MQTLFYRLSHLAVLTDQVAQHFRHQACKNDILQTISTIYKNLMHFRQRISNRTKICSLIPKPMPLPEPLQTKITIQIANSEFVYPKIKKAQCLNFKPSLLCKPFCNKGLRQEASRQDLASKPQRTEAMLPLHQTKLTKLELDNMQKLSKY